ncbi:UNKNOWN [Stylonychia lemnae]|uniref:AAA-ATPase-like domain-containing protein n=1 Tax=Stylonychia lemnae TaxID=5949 RepID=A0A078AZK2_STYLE|nr:UNKNOWN [Stylonychia lemnae]|eukprot:CDW87599.1 UNKNOWN [Stylonychia lemnae]
MKLGCSESASVFQQSTPMFDNFSQNEFTMIQAPEQQFSCVNDFHAGNGKKKQPKEKLKILKTNEFLKFYSQYSSYYVDKSLWIKEVLENKNRVQVYCRPRGMGKSMNLLMLQKFLDYRENTESIFSTLAINENQNQQIIDNYLNKHPVITLRFPKILKSCKGIDNVENDIYDFYNKDIKSLYLNTFQADMQLKEEPKKIINKLIDTLFSKLKKQVYILIDDYDFIFTQGLYHDFVNESLEIYKQILPKQWLYNEKIAKVIITGQYCIDIPRTCINNLDSSLVIMLNPSSPQAFGFNEKEVNQQMKNFKIDQKSKQKAMEFYNGFCYTYTQLYSPASINGFLYDYQNNKVRQPKSYQFSQHKLINKNLKLIKLEEKEFLDMLVDLFHGKIQIDYYSRLRLDQLKTTIVFTNFLIQSGYLCQDTTNETIKITNQEIMAALYKIYLKNLNINITSAQIIQYFRTGDFKNKSKNFNLDFMNTNLLMIEHRPEAYKHLVNALFLQDNLGVIRMIPFKLEDKEAVIIIDEETSRAWIMAIIFTRIRAQMRRQNLYVLEKMKNIQYKSDELQNIKRSYICAFAFFGKENLIYCVERNDFKLTDKKDTNDVIVRL